ncbi:MAG: hypothetical protein SPJ65_01245 [Roseburia sp.]|nr:hypothetical protein [Roseburia sp.]
MLIRSQNKSRLISLNNTRELRLWECKQGFDITDCVFQIGHYSTREKAMKVLDMIQKAYADAELIPMAVPNIGKILTETPTTKEKELLAETIREVLMNKMVFQMPEDGSVEV